MSVNGILDSDHLEPEEADTEAGGTPLGRELCATCQSLDLSVEKFVIYDETFKPFEKGSTRSFPGDRRHQPDFLLKSGSRNYQLGTLVDIQAKRETCPLCFLVLKSVEKPVASTESNSDQAKHVSFEQTNFDAPNPKAVCHVNWEIDGRDNYRTTGTKARTRRLHLQWNDETIKDSYLVFVAPQRLFDINSDAQGTWEKEAFFLGRDIKEDGNNQVLMKSWIDQCLEHHGDKCRSPPNRREFVEMANHSYFGVIDVLDMCLKSLPCRPSNGDTQDVYEQYIALSYVWGTKPNYITKVSNIQMHRRQGSLESFLGEIPRVIRDAMDLVRRLGLRYLWVDSLCIVQDNKRSWNLNSSVMNLVYGNAALTICAADGSDAWTGLKALDSSQRSASQYIEECVPGVRLMVSQLAETGINSSVWNTRAWTFQERLLSRRCLIFTEGRVFFQCRSATMSEDLVSETHGAGWSLDLAKALPQILLELNRRPIRVYINCVSRYSERNLTQPKDILAAFNGVSNLISDVMRAPFIFGLPSSHFDLALLWEPLQAVSRRIPQPKEDFKDLAFPSWSWCGWRGGAIEYRNSQLEGCLTNVREWLAEHTWIAWYVRDGRGNLRAVWDGEHSEDCDHVEERWRGYKHCRQSRPPPPDSPMGACIAPRSQSPYSERTVEIDRHERKIDIQIYGNDYQALGPVIINNNDYYNDEYGRDLPPEMTQRKRHDFQQCLPDNPFRVFIDKGTTLPDKDFPDQPLLQFWTWYASLRLINPPNQNTSLPGLCRYDIADDVGDWCGSIILDEDWVSKQEKRGRKVDGSKHDFLAISDAKAFTKDECDVWTYYVPKQRENSEWDLYYVLLVEQSERIWYRVAIGKVFSTAFDNAVPVKRWREIILG